MATCKTLIIPTSPSPLKPPIPKSKPNIIAFPVSASVSNSSPDTVEDLLTAGNSSTIHLTSMDRRSVPDSTTRWFPYLDRYSAGPVELSSSEVIEALDPYIKEPRKERIRRTVANRTYSLCLVVEGLTGFGNTSAAIRSADALGVQSVHVIARDDTKKRNRNRGARYRGNRHVSKGAELWLDIEFWKTPRECFEALRMRGYQIVTTHLGNDTVSVYELDWSYPTAIVLGNELMGLSQDALQLSDLHCSIPMNGMVDSFNVSVAAGILMHHAVCDRISRLGYHGDLTSAERQILVAEFFLRNRENPHIVHEYAKRKMLANI